MLLKTCHRSLSSTQALRAADEGVYDAALARIGEVSPDSADLDQLVGACPPAAKPPHKRPATVPAARASKKAKADTELEADVPSTPGAASKDSDVISQFDVAHGDVAGTATAAGWEAKTASFTLWQPEDICRVVDAAVNLESTIKSGREAGPGHSAGRRARRSARSLRCARGLGAQARRTHLRRPASLDTPNL